MTQSSESILLQLLERCLPFLTAAKTGFDVSDSMKKEAPFLQKDIVDILRISKNQEHERFIGILEEACALKKLGEI